MDFKPGKKVDVLAFPIHVRYKGLFDFEGLYQFMYNWLENKHYKFHEKLYKDKIDTALGNETEIKWEGEKRISEFIKYYVYIFIHLWSAKEVEVADNGVKKKMMRARMDIEFKASVQFDYNAMFKGSKSRVLMGKLLGWVKKNEWEQEYIDKLYYEVFRYQGDVKKFLNIEAKEGSYG